MTKAQAKERGSKGGLATLARHGNVHMAAIGRAGFAVTCERYHGGDVRRMMDWLDARRRTGATPYDAHLGCYVTRIGAFQ